MTWIVIKEERGKIKLVSKGHDTKTMLPKGTYLTTEESKSDVKHILRVVETEQDATFTPTAMLVDMDHNPLRQDRVSKNIIRAERIAQIPDTEDWHMITVLTEARKSTQEEIDYVMDSDNDGPRVFPATVYANKNRPLKDANGNYISVSLPKSMFFHQAMICGATGSGKTVALKYLAQYFAEEMDGAVLAINVKDVDLLKMEAPSTTKSEDVRNEWKSLGKKPKGIENFTIYYPSNSVIPPGQGVDEERTHKITLNVNSIDPDALSGLLHNVTDMAADFLPDIFRYWLEEVAEENPQFSNFVEYFGRASEEKRFSTKNSRGIISREGIQLAPGTYSNIQRNLHSAMLFFDDPDATTISATPTEGTYHILERGKMSVIDLHDESATKFGSVLLRHILKEIVEAKNRSESDVPILIIIDEVHRFYSNTGTQQALGKLNEICRTGRSQKIGVIFASQNARDMPRGISAVINTKIFFKSEGKSVSDQGLSVTKDEISRLKAGFAAASIHDMPELKIIKFPLAFAGVVDE